MRFHLRPGSFKKSFTDQTETLLIPAFVSLDIILKLEPHATLIQG